MLRAGSTLTDGPYRDHIRRASDYLIAHQQPNGLIGVLELRSERSEYMIGHAFALLLLAHVYGDEEDVDRHKRIQNLLLKAVEFSRLAECKKGGWGLAAAGDKAGSGILGDDKGDARANVFATLAQLQALRAAQSAGIVVPAAVLDRAQNYLEKEDDPLELSASVVPIYGSKPYKFPSAAEWLTPAHEPTAPVSGSSLVGEYLCFGQAELASCLEEDGFAKLLPMSKVAERLTWSGYEKAIFPIILKAQSDDGSWGRPTNAVYMTALNLAILLLKEPVLPGPWR